MSEKAIIKKFMCCLLTAGMLFIISTFALFYYKIYGEHQYALATQTALVEKVLEANTYDVVYSSVPYKFIEPEGDWWIKLDEGFDIGVLESNPDFFPYHTESYQASPPSQKEIKDRISTIWGYQAEGFQYFFANRPQISDDTCHKDMLFNCMIDIYAKDGDPNVFIRISIW